MPWTNVWDLIQCTGRQLNLLSLILVIFIFCHLLLLLFLHLVLLLILVFVTLFLLLVIFALFLLALFILFILSLLLVLVYRLILLFLLLSLYHLHYYKVDQNKYFHYCSFIWIDKISILMGCQGLKIKLFLIKKYLLFLPNASAYAYFLSLTKSKKS